MIWFIVGAAIILAVSSVTLITLSSLIEKIKEKLTDYKESKKNFLMKSYEAKIMKQFKEGNYSIFHIIR